MNEQLANVSGIETPYVPEGCEHVYYQYCVYTPDRDAMVRQALVRGMDLETMHVDVCATLPLFGGGNPATPKAEQAAHVVQLPVYASLGLHRARRVARTVRRLAHR
jgi:dTDP-4-amino-4,6-dideoxygalactose transaminase